ncbi:MAG: methyltransferase domain-containing protein [Hyphomicrobiaceae bacterium]
MQPDVTDLMDFYARPIGALVRRLLTNRVRAIWGRVDGATLVGLGFATPYLGSFRGEARRVIALMPYAQGALVWPQAGPVASVLVDELHLPLPDNSVDHLLLVHALEACGTVRPLLREIWRVLKPEGHLLIVVPNRRGVWARLDTTPFGNGQPFSTGQLHRLLAEALLTPVATTTALHMPPIDRRLVVRSGMTWERIGRRISPLFGGVILMEARKDLAAPLIKGSPARIAPKLVPSRNAAFASDRRTPDDRIDATMHR